MTMVVRPARRRRSAANTISSEIASSDEVGSSRIRIGRVLQDRARDAQPLALAARQAAAGLGDLGVVALRQPRDELVRVRRARRLLDLLVGGVEPPVAQVVGDRAREEHRILQHDRDLLAQRSHAVLPHVDAVDRHAARRSRRRSAGSG